MLSTSSDPQRRRLPNILITGTPGTGKTTLSELVTSQCTDTSYPMDLINVNERVIAKGFHDGKDEQFNSLIVDETQLLDDLEDTLCPIASVQGNTEESPSLEPQQGIPPGGYIVDTHSPSLFPPNWFDLIIILRTWNDNLYPRLEARSYPQHKISENITAEIMQVVLEEAVDHFSEDKCWEMRSDVADHMQKNSKRICKFIEEWRNGNVEEASVEVLKEIDDWAMSDEEPEEE